MDVVRPPYGETLRKLRLLAERYQACKATRGLRVSIATQHRSMFGVSLIEEDTGAHRKNVERSGLILTEKTLGLLAMEGITERGMETYLRERLPNDSRWIARAWDEWNRPAAAEGPGKWWPMPVFPAVLKCSDSSFRTVALGLELMGLIDKTKATSRRGDMSRRAKVMRITPAGLALLNDFRRNDHA